MTNLSLARIMYGTSQEYHSTGAQTHSRAADESILDGSGRQFRQNARDTRRIASPRMDQPLRQALNTPLHVLKRLP